MTGAEFLPQVSILPHVDLVITHGGNNTVTESLRFGRPTVLLPLFWDQYDNAQRLHETGFGVRLDTYAHAPEELTGAIERLLADAPLHDAAERAVEPARRRRPGTVKAADLIERAVSRSSVTRTCRAAPRALPPACVERLRAADAILHAGDLMEPSVLEELAGARPAGPRRARERRLGRSCRRGCR